MKPALLPLALLHVLALQDQTFQVSVATVDGQKIVGVTPVESVSVVTSVGTVELPLKKLASIKFQSDQVTATGRDGTKLTGKMKLDDISVKSLVGGLTIARKDLSSIDMGYSSPTPLPAPAPKDRILTLQVETVDLNTLVGTVNLDSVTIESTLGKFEINPAQMSSLLRAKEKWTIILRDGSVIVGTVALQELTIRTGTGEIAIKPEKIAQIYVRDVRIKDPPRPPPESPKSTRPAPLKPSARVELKANLADLVLHKEGKLYAVNVTTSRLHRWRLSGLEEEASGPFAGNLTDIAIDPSGGALYAVGKGCVSIFDRESLKQSKSFAVEHNLNDLIWIDQDTLLATGSGTTVLISISKTAVVQNLSGGGSTFTMLREADRILVGDATLQVVRAPGAPVRIDWLASNWGSQYETHALAISPDGRWGVSRYGALYRIGKTVAARRKYWGQLERECEAAAFSDDGAYVYTFSRDGYLKLYDTQDFKLSATHFLSVCATQVVVEPGGKALVIAGFDLRDRGIPGAELIREGSDTSVNLYRFEIPK